MRSPSTILTMLIDNKGWSQLELSRQSGISRQNIGNWVLGKSAPGADSVAKLCDALGATREE